MALKYWYKAANGSDNWAVAGNWYNGSGGTGGTTTIPTAADDVILDANSGSGTIFIAGINAAASTCLSLNCTGFTGTLAGASTLACAGSFTFGSGMTVTHSGTTTFTGSGSNITCNGKIFAGNVTFNGSGSFSLYDFKTVSTATVTLTAGTLNTYSSGTYGLECGLFVSTGSATRAFWGFISGNNFWNITGIGTVWSVSGTNITCWDLVDSLTGNLYFTNSSSSTKTISHGLTGYNVPGNTEIGGTGSGSFVISSTSLYSLYFTNTGGATISFGTTTIQADLDFGTSNVNWNGTTALTLISNNYNFRLSPNMTITNSGPITVSTGATAYVFLYSNGKTLTGNLTINATLGGISMFDNLTVLGIVTLTRGDIAGGLDLYASSFSSSNANTRSIYLNNLYLTGTGTLVTATTTTNLSTSIANIYVTNSSATAKSLTLNSFFYPYNGVYLAGSGSGTMTLSAGTSAAYTIYVTNTGGAPISFSTATILSIEFSIGTNAVWATASSGQTLTITNSLFIAPSAGNPTLTPTLIFTGNGSGVVNVTLNGKSLVSGTCTLNDTSYSANSINYYFDGFSSNAAFTVTSAGTVIFNGPFTGPSYTSTSASGNYFTSSLTLTGALSLANNAQPNAVQVLGNFSAASISHLATGTIELRGTTSNVTTSITLNNAISPAQFYHEGTLTTSTFTITNGNLDSVGNLNCTTLTIGNGNVYFYNNIVTLTGIFTLTSGTLYGQNATFSSLTFVSTASANARDISLNNSSWTLTGTGTVWNVVNGGTISGSTSTLDIYIINTSVSALTFAGADLSYKRLFIRRGALNTNQVIITGSNTFDGLYHTGGSSQTLTFTAGTTTYIYDTFAVGSSSANTNINSTSTGATFNLVKVNPGLVICNNVSITRSAASPANTWYAVNSTNVAGNTGWIFGPPSRRLSSLGTG